MCVCVCEREREREGGGREAERDRQRDREEREIHTDRQTQRDRDSAAPCIAVEVILHVWSTGGYIVNVTRTEHLENCKDYVGRLEPLMAKLEAMGRWKEFNRVIFPNFLRGKEGVAIIHRVL